MKKPRQMSRWLYALALLAFVLPLSSGAEAVQADATLRLEKQGWYWRPAQRVNAEPPVCAPPDTGVPCPNVQQQPNPFEVDHFVTGFTESEAGTPEDRPELAGAQAVAVFQLDVSFLAPDTKVFAAELILEESRDDVTHPNRRPSGTSNADAPGTKLRACLVTEFWGPSQPGLWNEVPPIDCKKAQGKGTRTMSTVDGREIPVWVFDLTPIAKVWGKDPFANYGVAIVPAADAAGDFHIGFHGDTRVITQDPVTRREQIEDLIRIRATMRFDAPAKAIERGRTLVPAGGSGSTVSLGPLFGAPNTSFGDAPGPFGGGSGVPDVNRDVKLERAPAGAPGTLIAVSAQTPPYVLLAILAGLALTRLLSLLFVSGATPAPVNRVAAAYRRGTGISLKR